MTRQALYIAVIYFTVSAIYIYFSDLLLAGLVTDTIIFSHIQSYKGLGFVLLTAILIYFLVNRQMNRKNALIRDLSRKKNEFETLYEEYLSSNEELNHANELLGRSEKTLLTTLYSIGDALITTDRDGMVLRMNPVAERLTGWTEHEARGLPSSSIFRIADEFTGKEVENPILKVLRKEKGIHLARHSVLVSKNGRTFPVADSGSPILSDEGEIEGAVIVFRDQTEERKAQRSLLINQFCIDHSSIGIYRINEDRGLILDENDSMHELFGYTAEEFEKLTIYDLDPSLTRERWKEITPFLKEKGSATLETTNRRKDGSFLPVEVTVSYFEFQDEAFYFSFVKDISERKMNIEELEESEARYRNIFENQHTIMFLIDPEHGTVVDANPAAVNFYGWTREEFKNMKVSDINLLTEKDIYGFINEVRTGRTGFEFRHRLANGEVRDIETFTGLIQVHRKELVFTIVNDITERKISREELIRAKEKAEENDKLKSAFLNNMSHEIRTPMNGILGFSSLLSQPDLNAEKRYEFIRIIESSGEQLVRIIDDIIDYSRIETGQVSIIMEKFGLNEMLETIIALIREDMIKKNKNLDIRLHKGLPDGSDGIVSDRARLSQILINLAMNSLKFTEEGFIETGYLVREGVIEFYVKDTGIGIPEIDQEKIFDRFHQANLAIARSYSGTGLGLSIARGLTELLGGGIDFTSKTGRGTTFFIHMPYEPVDIRSAPSERIIPASGFKEKTILIAEDVPESLELISNYFGGTGAIILRASNGKEALDLVRTHKSIDLVLMDIRMPVMDGLEALKTIKKLRPGLPVIAQTAYAMVPDRELFLHNGFDDYISKPVDRKSLMLIAGKYLGT